MENLFMPFLEKTKERADIKIEAEPQLADIFADDDDDYNY